jgi:zinc and cadmium transporter
VGGRWGFSTDILHRFQIFAAASVWARPDTPPPGLGIATTLAIVAHAVPQQVGDFAELLHSGFTRSKAFGYNIGTGLATLFGALAAYGALAHMQQLLPTVLAIASASLLYVAVADLIPSLHRRSEPLETAKQMLWIALGIAIIATTHMLLEPA